MIKTNDLDKTVDYLGKLVDTFLSDVTMTSHKSWPNERIILLTKDVTTREYEIEMGFAWDTDPLNAALAIIKLWWADKTVCRCLGFAHKETCPEWVLPY